MRARLETTADNHHQVPALGDLTATRVSAIQRRWADATALPTYLAFR